jgi:hypothetical protein
VTTPEPSSFALMGIGILGIAVAFKKRRRLVSLVIADQECIKVFPDWGIAANDKFLPAADAHFRVRSVSCARAGRSAHLILPFTLTRVD